MATRESRQIWWMPVYKKGDPRIIKHYQRAIGKNCSPKRAADLFRQDTVDHWKDREGSRIQFDAATDTWRGREVRLPGAKYGILRKGDSRDSLRGKLSSAVGSQYLTKTEVREILEDLYGATKVRSKLTQAYNKGILKYCQESDRCYLWVTQPPNPKDFGPETRDTKSAAYIRLYGSMPRGLKHKPGDVYSPEDSQVLKWIGQQSDSTDLQWLESERDKAFKAGAFKFDPKTKETIGILTYQEEQKAKEPAKQEIAPKVKKNPVKLDGDFREYLSGHCDDVYDSEKALFEHMKRIYQEFNDADIELDQIIPAMEQAVGEGLWRSGPNEVGKMVWAAKAYWDKQAEEKQRIERLERLAETEAREKQRADRLRAESEKLRDLPANTGMVELVDFIGKHCDLSEVGWPEIFQCARENSFIIFDSGISRGVNSTSP